MQNFQRDCFFFRVLFDIHAFSVWQSRIVEQVSDGLGMEGRVVAEGCLECSGNYVVEVSLHMHILYFSWPNGMIEATNTSPSRRAGL